MTDTLRERASRRGRTARVNCGALGGVTVEALSPMDCAALARQGGRALLYAACRELQASGEELRREGLVYKPDEIMQFVTDREAAAAARVVMKLSGLVPEEPEDAEEPGESADAEEPGESADAEEPGESEGPREPGEPEALERPEDLEIPERPGIPKDFEAPEGLDEPETLESLEISGSSEIPEIPAALENSGTPESLEEPESLEVPEEPEEPEEPDMPESGEKGLLPEPGESGSGEVPGTPEVLAEAEEEPSSPVPPRGEPRENPVKRFSWGEEEGMKRAESSPQGGDGVERNFFRRRPDLPEVRLNSVQTVGGGPAREPEKRLGSVREEPYGEPPSLPPDDAEEEVRKEDGQASREFFPLPGNRSKDTSKPRMAQNLPGELQIPLQDVEEQAGGKYSGGAENKSRKTAGREAAHEVRPEIPEASHENKSEIPEASHENESEIPEASHETKSEFEAVPEITAHESKSEIPEASHEIKSEFTESGYETGPDSGAGRFAETVEKTELPDMEAFAQALLVGLRRAAGAR